MRFQLDPFSPTGVSIKSEQQVRTVTNAVPRLQTLNDLQDVVVAGTPLDDQALAYDSATNKFIPQTISSGTGSTTLDALTDVTLTTPSTGQVLKYNGTAWINDTDASGTADHGALTGLANDDHTQYHTDARGDVRYYVKATVDSYLAEKAALSGAAFTGTLSTSNYLRVGNNGALANASDGDVYGTRLFLGLTAATASRSVDVRNTTTETTSGAKIANQFLNTITPTTNSLSEFRALVFENYTNAVDGITYATVRGGYFNNRLRHTGTSGTVNGLWGQAVTVDSASPATVGTVTLAQAFNAVVHGRPSGTSTVNITTGVGYDTNLTGLGSTVNDLVGLRVNNPNGTATNFYGVEIANITGVTGTNAGIRVGTPSGAINNYAIQLRGTEGTPNTGLTFGTDTNLYRSAVDTLKTDDNLVVAGTVNGRNMATDGAKLDGLATVATSGSYNDLSNKPDLTTLNDVRSYLNLAGFPATGTTDHVYIAEDTGYMYRWNGTSYTQLTDQTAIWGQVSGTLSNQTDLQTALNGKVDDAEIANFETTTQLNSRDTANRNTDNHTSGTTNKVFSAIEQTKLTGIEAGAQVNTVTSVASRTGAVTLVKADVGLANVDNTSDISKPISTAQQTALDTKADKTGASDIEITDTLKGVILKSPNGTRFRITVGDDGALTTTGVV